MGTAGSDHNAAAIAGLKRVRAMTVDTLATMDATLDAELARIDAQRALTVCTRSTMGANLCAQIAHIDGSLRELGDVPDEAPE